MDLATDLHNAIRILCGIVVTIEVVFAYARVTQRAVRES